MARWRHLIEIISALLERELSKQWRRWWFETPPRSLWHHCNAYVCCLSGRGTELLKEAFTRTYSYENTSICDSSYQQGLTLNPAWISYHMPSEMRHETTYTFSIRWSTGIDNQFHSTLNNECHILATASFFTMITYNTANLSTLFAEDIARSYRFNLYSILCNDILQNMSCYSWP